MRPYFHPWPDIHTYNAVSYPLFAFKWSSLLTSAVHRPRPASERRELFNIDVKRVKTQQGMRGLVGQPADPCHVQPNNAHDQTNSNEASLYLVIDCAIKEFLREREERETNLSKQDRDRRDRQIDRWFLTLK